MQRDVYFPLVLTSFEDTQCSYNKKRVWSPCAKRRKRGFTSEGGTTAWVHLAALLCGGDARRSGAFSATCTLGYFLIQQAHSETSW